MERCRAWQQEFEFITEVRSVGMMIGIELAVDAASMVEECLQRGLLINCTQGNVLRLLPAMNLTDQDLQEGCDLLQESLASFRNNLSVKV